MVAHALPFAISFLMVPAVALGAVLGGWWLALPFLYGWVITSLLDRLLGRDPSALPAGTAETALVWHRAITIAWVPLQFGLIAFCLWALAAGHLRPGQEVALMLGLGVATGGIGITYAHELIHRPAAWERALGEALLVPIGYGHFATEHVHGHHRTVATPADPVSARRGEGFYRFLVRAVLGSLVSAFAIERRRLRGRGRPVWHWTNPFWRYGLGFAAALGLAQAAAGWSGVGLYLLTALMGIYQLEAVNYVEHYGLTRRLLPDGRFERAGPQHSWNASHRVTNWLLINLQRHSDHHARPDRRFPLLQSYDHTRAPQLPYGYPLMVLCALVPPLWFRLMDKRVARWRQRFYPEIGDWRAYEDGSIGSDRIAA